MAGPPVGVKGDELFLLLTQMPRPAKEVDHPRRHPPGHEKAGEPIGKVLLWPIYEAELMAVRASAELYAKQQLKEDKPSRDSLGYEQIYQSAAAVEWVARACRSPSDPRAPWFPDSVGVRKWLFPDEIAVLMTACALWQTECGPIVSQMTPEELDAFLDRLEEAGDSLPLSLVTSDVRNALLMRSVERHRRLRMASGSAGSPHAGSSTDGSKAPSEPSGSSDSPSSSAPAAEEAPTTPTVDT